MAGSLARTRLPSTRTRPWRKARLTDGTAHLGRVGDGAVETPGDARVEVHLVQDHPRPFHQPKKTSAMSKRAGSMRCSALVASTSGTATTSSPRSAAM